MKVQQLFLRNVRNIKELDLDFRDPVTGKPLSRIVLAGANGSGKTTIFECAFELIRSLTLSESQFSYPAWGNGSLQLILQPRNEAKHSWEILFNSPGKRGSSYLEWRDEYNYGLRRITDGDVDNSFSMQEDYEEFVQKASLIYLTDNRRLLPTASGPIAPEEENPWAYRYTPTDQWKGSVESFLVWQNYLDLEDRDKGIGADRFQRVVSVVNQILDQKHIAGVERGRVVIEISGQKKHSLNELSSGERQLLLMLVEITRHIKPGGIILIDEPEISLHEAWQRGLMAALDKIIEHYKPDKSYAHPSLKSQSLLRASP